MIPDQAIGCDIEEIGRFREDITQSSRFLDRVFTRNEQEYCLSYQDPASHFAARYCAKEAVVKALCSLGLSPLPFSSIEIVHDDGGVPRVILHPEGEGRMKYLNLEIQVSMSHSPTIAMAVSLVRKILR